MYAFNPWKIFCNAGFHEVFRKTMIIRELRRWIKYICISNIYLSVILYYHSYLIIVIRFHLLNCTHDCCFTKNFMKQKYFH